ncbi:putative glycosyl transferase [bacterium BMS3Abin05]|nr:putative glycosyl transferase [bacterium BMS3Abin05]GBE26254.1 putative glycosyl transferase [bacterium BMS3Bbin03]
MSRLSVLILAKNESANIEACLRSVGWADEIAVIDTGSTDDTVAKARHFTDNVFVTQWRGFAGTKNWGLRRLTGDWVLWLDADERVTPDLAEEIQKVLRTPRFDGYQIPRKANFLGHWILHGGWYPGYVLRLIKRELAEFTDTRVHEGLKPPRNVGRLKQPLLHFTDPTLAHYFDKFNRYTSLAAQDLKDRGRRFHWYDLLFRPPHLFVKMYLLKAGFLDGFAGFLLAVLSGFYVFAKYAKLWEKDLK